MKIKAPVIVIGGGYFGTSITYHLAKQGIKVVLVEKNELASGSSGANFGCVQVQDAEPGISLDLTLKSFAMWQSFKDDLGIDVEYRPRGHLLAAASQREWENLLSTQTLKKSQGLKYEVLSPQDVERVEPAISSRNLAGATLSREASINPFKLIYGMGAKAEEYGAKVYQYTKVKEIKVSQHKVTEVVTDKGVFSGDLFVLATGAWTSSIGAKIGLDIPVSYIKGEALVSEVLPPLLNNYYGSASFFAEAHDAEGANTALCLAQTKSGNLVIGETSRPKGKQIDLDTKDHNSLALCKGIYEQVAKFFPSLLNYNIIRSWQTFSPYTEMHRPVFNFVGYDNLLVAAGFKSAAIMVPLIGQAAVDLLKTGRLSKDMEKFSIL